MNGGEQPVPVEGALKISGVVLLCATLLYKPVIINFKRCFILLKSRKDVSWGRIVRSAGISRYALF